METRYYDEILAERVTNIRAFEVYAFYVGEMVAEAVVTDGLVQKSGLTLEELLLLISKANKVELIRVRPARFMWPR